MRCERSAFLLAVVAGVAAQADDAIDKCREESSAERRIACLEAALRQESSVPANDAPDDEPQRRDDVESRSAPGDLPDAQPDARADVSASASGIGEEQVRARNDTRDDIGGRLASASGLRVAAYSEVPYRRLQIELENGQIWRQVEGDTQRFNVDLERNQTVDISQSRISGYNLRLNEIRRIISVERVR